MILSQEISLIFITLIFVADHPPNPRFSFRESDSFEQIYKITIPKRVHFGMIIWVVTLKSIYRVIQRHKRPELIPVSVA